MIRLVLSVAALLPASVAGQAARDTVLSLVAARIETAHARTATTLVGLMSSCNPRVSPSHLCVGNRFSDAGREQVAYASLAVSSALNLTLAEDHARRARSLLTAHYLTNSPPGRSCNGNAGAVTVLLPSPVVELAKGERWRVALDVLFVPSGDVTCEVQGTLYEYLVSRDSRTGGLAVDGPKPLLIGHGYRNRR